jgi:hypothetical protein
VIAREDELEALGEEPHMRKFSLQLAAGQQAECADVSLRSKGMLQLYTMWIPCFLMNATGGYIFGGMTAIKYVLPVQATHSGGDMGILMISSLPVYQSYCTYAD